MRRLLVIALIAGVTTGCGSSLTDAQRVWCRSHDMSQPTYFGTNDGVVIKAAESLNIAVPDSIRFANAYFENAGRPTPDLPQGWPAALDQWRTTSDYARACVAAFEGR